MTSAERHEQRYIRRKKKRKERKAEFAREYDDFAKVFSYENLYCSYKKRRQNVAWKASVQHYISQAPGNVYRTYMSIQNGKWRPGKFYCFDIHERGKLRHIQAVGIGERVVQGCLCDFALMPMLGRSFIYANSASQIGKGYHFAIRRLCTDLRKTFRKHGRNAYVLLFDFKSFFDSISHEVCKRILRSTFNDRRIIQLTQSLIDVFGDRGLGLGSQISQAFALAVPNRLDHYIKEILRIREYGRYMDDGYLIHEDKGYLKNCLVQIREVCATIGLTLNMKKTHIVKLTHCFTWLKCRIRITESGKVIKKMCKTSATRERRRLKKLGRYLQTQKLTTEDIRQSLQSWLSYAENFNSFRTRENVKSLDFSLYGVTL